MIGQSASIDPTVAFAETLRAMERRVAELERRESLRPIVQHDATSLALDASGRGTITFPIEFPGTPTITATIVLNTTTTMTPHVVSKSASGFEVQVDSDGTAAASVTRQVNWTAIYG